MHYRDFVSGAMIANILSRAKKLAIKDELQQRAGSEQGIGGREGGIAKQHLLQAIATERAESEYVPTSTNPEEWTKIISQDHAGARVERVELLTARRSA